MTAQPAPSYPCPDCPCITSELCWTCTLPFEHLKVLPVCEFCGETATIGIIAPYRIEGEMGITYAGFDTYPVCDNPACLEEAEYLRSMTQ